MTCSWEAATALLCPYTISSLYEVERKREREKSSLKTATWEIRTPTYELWEVTKDSVDSIRR